MTPAQSIPRRRLAEISESIEYGITASATSEAVGPRFLRITDIQDERVEWDAVPYCECPESDLRRYSLQAGDIVFARTGATTGKSFLITSCPERTVFASYLIRVRPSREVDPQFLSQFFKTPDYWNQISVVANGSAQPGVNGSKLKDLSVPLPPIQEQRRIAAILDKADAIRRKREEGIRLTEELLRSTFLDMFGDPTANPKGWDTQPFGNLARNEDGRRKPVKEADRAERQGNYPYYGASGIIDHVDDYLFDERTLLIAEDGANLLARATPIAFIAEGKYWVNNHAHVVSDNGRADLDFLRFSLNLRRLDDFVTGSAQPKLNQASLNRIPIPLPPLSTQRKFAGVVRTLNKLSEHRKSALGETAGLFDSLVQRAFRGEL